MCDAINQRAELTEAVQRACFPMKRAFSDAPADGSEKSLIVAFAVLHGVVGEYLDGGDQIVENCSCGQHTN